MSVAYSILHKKEKRHAPLPKGLELVGLRNENLYNSFRRKLLPREGARMAFPDAILTEGR